MNLELDENLGSALAARSDDELLSARDVGLILKCHPVTVNRLAKRGDLPRIVFSNKFVRYRRSDVEALLAEATK